MNETMRHLIDLFYEADNDHDRAIAGAVICGFLEYILALDGVCKK